MDDEVKQMLRGLLFMIGGIAITYVTYSAASEEGEGAYYVLCLAPVLFGFADFVSGLREWLRYR